MSRGREVRGVVVAHGDLAEALVRAVQGIAGVRGGIRAVSNRGCTPAALRERIEQAVGAGPALVFVDMASGSCAHAGRSAAEGREDVVVVTGANLPMLLDFVFHREMEPAALARRVAGRGRDATTVRV